MANAFDKLLKLLGNIGYHLSPLPAVTGISRGIKEITTPGKQYDFWREIAGPTIEGAANTASFVVPGLLAAKAGKAALAAGAAGKAALGTEAALSAQKALQGASALTKLQALVNPTAYKAASAAAFGARGAGMALQEGKTNPLDIAKSAAISGATGYLVPGADVLPTQAGRRLANLGIDVGGGILSGQNPRDIATQAILGQVVQTPQEMSFAKARLAGQKQAQLDFATKLKLADEAKGSQIQDIGSPKQVAERNITGVGQRQATIEQMKKNAASANTEGKSLQEMMAMSRPPNETVTSTVPGGIPTARVKKLTQNISTKPKDNATLTSTVTSNPVGEFLGQTDGKIKVGGGEYSGNVQFADDLREFALSEQNQNALAAKRGTESWGEVKSKVDALSPEDLLKLEKTDPHVVNSGLIDITKRTLNRINADINEQKSSIEELTKKGIDTKSAENVLQALETKKNDFLINLQTQATTAGRALNYIKSVTNEMASPASRLKISISRYADKFKDMDSVFKIVDQLPQDRQLNREEAIGLFGQLAKEEINPNSKLFNDIWYNSILSGTHTQIVNVLGNTARLGWNVATRPLAAGIDALRSKLTGSERSVFAGETAALLQSAKTAGVKDGASKFIAALQTGYRNSDIEALQSGSGFRLPEAMGTGLKGAAQKSVRLPGRMLTAVDEFFQAVNNSSELYALAYQKAAKEGISNGWDNKKVLEAAADYIQSPPSDILKAASERATELTFRSKSGLSKHIEGIRDSLSIDVPGLGKVRPLDFIIPFVTTPINIIKFGYEASPLGLVTTLAKGAKMEGREFATKAASGVMGSLMMGALGTQFLNGNITGNVPKDKQERDAFFAAGKQPWSVRIGDTWIPYNKIEPLNNILSTLANFHDNFIATGEPPSIKSVQGFLQGQAKNMADQTFLKGIGDFWNAIEQPEQYGDNYLNTIATGFLPYGSLLQQVAKVGDQKQRRPETIGQAFMAKIPGLRQNVPTVTSSFEPGGEALKKYNPLLELSPIRPTKANDEMDKIGTATLANRYVKAAKAGSTDAIVKLKKLLPGTDFSQLAIYAQKKKELKDKKATRKRKYLADNSGKLNQAALSRLELLLGEES